MVRNKKGISAVIANVLIVLLVIASIGIIWAVVRPTIQSAGEQVSSDCFSLLINAESCSIFGGKFCVGGDNDEGACIDDTDCPSAPLGACAPFEEVRVGVSRDPGAGTLGGIRFIVTGVLNKIVSDSDANSGSLPNELETSSFVLTTVANSGVLEGIAPGDTIDVSAVIGEQQTLCNPSGLPVVCTNQTLN